MRLVMRSPQFHIYDDVLPPQDFEALWRYVESESYMSVHAQGWRKVWRLSDGHPFLGPAVYSRLPAEARGTEAGAPREYPSGTMMDVVLQTLLEHAPRFAELVGKREEHWSAVTASPFLYPPGTALSWHTDQATNVGAFTFYVHRRWSCQWGGELLVADEACEGSALGTRETEYLDWAGRKVGRLPASTPHLDHEREDEVLGHIGLGHYITPKPNRLVVLRGGVPHRINRVDPAAGDHVRCTVSGFFLRKDPPQMR